MNSPSPRPRLCTSAPRRRVRAPHGASALSSALSFSGTVALLATASALLLLGGCSGDDEPTVAVTGLVADGPLHGATVCYDLNDNGSCDAGEPSTSTGADGKYALDIAESAAGLHGVVAQVPATAIDRDTNAAVGVAFTLRTVPTGAPGAQDVFVSPVTTLVADIARDSGKSAAEAAAQVQAALSLQALPLAPHIPAAGSADLLLAGRALGALTIQTIQLAAASGVPAAQVAALVREATSAQLPVLAAALADSTAGTTGARAQEAAAAALAAMNLSATSVLAVADQLAQPAGTADAPGPFVSLRRFAYTDANTYSYTVFVGDSSITDSNGRFKASEVRHTLSAGTVLPFNRNQVYWTGTEWKTCEREWEVSHTKSGTATAPQLSTYCGASASETRVVYEDIAGQTLRAVVTRFRAHPLADSIGASTDPVSGLPVNWGPDPALLPEAATFPAGSKMSSRTQRADIGGVDRIELTSKSSVRWPDGFYRQATSLEQYSGMPGNLVDAAVVPGNANTVFVSDLAMAAQPDAALETFKRFRAGFDVAGQRIRFYKCDLRRADQAAINCETVGDGTLAISTQGGLRLLRVATGYPAELTSRLSQQRYWVEFSGAVFRGMRDLERTRYDQRLNATAWAALRTALNIPEHTAPTAPVASGPFANLRSFSFTDAANYSWRTFEGDNSVLDANGNFAINETRRTMSAGVLQPFARNRSYWTGSEWYDCPSDGVGILTSGGQPPYRGIYCKTYLDERVGSVTLTLGGRLMADVVNDIRAYGSTDNGDAYNDWGPTPSANPQLASTRFPEGATMDYRGHQASATPPAIATAVTDQVRVAPAPNTSAAFNTWPFAASLEDMVARYPGGLIGTTLNGNTSLFVWRYTATPSSALYTNQVEIRVAFDANGNQARFTQNNRLVSNGNSTNYTTLLDTTYSIETVGGVRLLKFAALPAGFEDQFRFTRMYAERDGGVWYAFKDKVSASPVWTIRLNKTAADALKQALGIL